MRQRRVLVVLVVGMMLIAGRARTPAATPLATPLAPHCPPGWRFGQGGACVLPPCNPRAVALTSGRVAARLDRTPEDLIVRLQPIPLAPSLSALSLGRDSVAWAVPSWAQAGSHVSQPARLYLADLRYFRPTLVAQSCAGFADVRLSARWLVWSQPVFLGLNRPGTSRIWVLDLHTGRRSLVNADAFPARSVYDEGSLSLGDDAVTWARGLGIQPHTNFVARMAIVTRRLPDRPITSLVPAAAVNLDNAGAPHLQSISDPQRSGNLLVWARARWTGRGPSTDLLMMNLSTGLQRVVASGGAAYPVTNGRKIAWDGPSGRPWEPLLRYDVVTGRRAVLSTAANSFSALMRSPTIAGHVLAWRTFALVHGRDTYGLVARDLRTGRQYRLGTGGDVGEPGAVLSGPGWGWANRVVWGQTVDDAAGPRASYLAFAAIP